LAHEEICSDAEDQHFTGAAQKVDDQPSQPVARDRNPAAVPTGSPRPDHLERLDRLDRPDHRPQITQTTTDTRDMNTRELRKPLVSRPFPTPRSQTWHPCSSRNTAVTKISFHARARRNSGPDT